MASVLMLAAFSTLVIVSPTAYGRSGSGRRHWRPDNNLVEPLGREASMVLTTSELIATLQHEVRILLHLASKVEPSMLGYRPTPKQRSTLELLQYMAIMGPTQLTVIEHGAFDRPTLSATWSPAEADAKKMSFDQALTAIGQQSDEYAR